MKLYYHSIIAALSILYIPLSYALEAPMEVGSNCPSAQFMSTVSFQVNNNLEYPVALRVPRNEWICYDFHGNQTPGQLDGLRFEPGESKTVTLNAAHWNFNILAAAAMSPFTLKASICYSQDCTEKNELRLRLAVTTARTVPTKILAIYSPLQYTYADEGNVVYQEFSSINGRTPRAAFKANYFRSGTVLVSDKNVMQKVTFEYRQ